MTSSLAPGRVDWEHSAASPTRRVLGHLVDQVVYSLLAAGAILVVGGSPEALLAPGELTGLLLVLGTAWVLAAHGISAGKLLLSTRIVRVVDGERPGLVRGGVREVCWPVMLTLLVMVVGPMAYLLGVVNVLLVLGTPTRRALHDHAAGTVVVDADLV